MRAAFKDNPRQWNPDMWGVDPTKAGTQAYYDSIAELDFWDDWKLLRSSLITHATGPSSWAKTIRGPMLTCCRSASCA